MKQSLNLSGIISLILGAEPIRKSSITSFVECFAPYGMREEVMMPAFGLAENVLHAAGKLSNSYPPCYLYVDQSALQNGTIVPVDEHTHDNGKWLVSCGELKSKDPTWFRKSIQHTDKYI